MSLLLTSDPLSLSEEDEDRSRRRRRDRDRPRCNLTLEPLEPSPPALAFTFLITSAPKSVLFTVTFSGSDKLAGRSSTSPSSLLVRNADRLGVLTPAAAADSAMAAAKASSP